jgi:hypothetical protein
MPTWGEILQEFQTPSNTPDSIRRKYLIQLAAHTGRDVILYSTKWTDPSGVNPDVISITEEDIQGFMEVVHGLKNPNLDLIIHSPGGSPVATKAIVKYLRKKFTDIRVNARLFRESNCYGETFFFGPYRSSVHFADSYRC